MFPQTLFEPTGNCTIKIRGTALVNRSSLYEVCKAPVGLDGMCTRGGKAGNAMLLGFEIGKIRTIFWNSTVNIAVGNACGVYDGFLRLKIPPTA